jgi:hypothetical protein
MFKLPEVAPIEYIEGREVLIDADVVAYYASFGLDDTGFSPAETKCDIRMQQIIDECQATKYRAFLTGDNNFRNKVATLQRYKGNRYDADGVRITPQPEWLPQIRQYLVSNWHAELCDGEEADDVLSYTQAENIKNTGKELSVISTVDKDLLINPGWHHNMSSGYLQEVTEEGTLFLDPKGKVRGTGMRFFFAQMLMGDSADWIPGLPKITPAIKENIPTETNLRNGGCGPKAAMSILADCETIQEMHDKVYACYILYWGEHSYCHWRTGQEFKSGVATANKQFIEQGRLLWMRREPKEMWNPLFPLR